MIYNILNKSRLNHNVSLYRKLKLKKFYFSPISSKDFINIDPTILSQNKEIKKLSETNLFKNLPPEDQQSLLNFDKDGYAILKGYLNKEDVDQINQEVDRSIATKALKYRYGNKIMFAYRKIPLLRKVASEENLIELLSSLLSDKAMLFQSINFLKGSEQETHSDSIHMTTFPLGGLLGVWIALEDIEIENGPLHYFMIGDKDYSEYEIMIKNKIRESSLEKKVFYAKAGDLLIWHANLFHGGEKHTNKNKTRKSVVFHYYADNSICYHEITQRPTLFE
jgi:hypothetical protein